MINSFKILYNLIAAIQEIDNPDGTPGGII
jgi:hypothetical protein